MTCDLAAYDDETAMLLCAFEKAGTPWPPPAQECVTLERTAECMAWAIALHAQDDDVEAEATVR